MNGRVAILLCVFLFFLGCDQLTRFKQEKMECQTRLYGPLELIFNSKKLGANIKIIGKNSEKHLRIIDRSDDFLVAEGDDLSTEIDLQSKKVTLRVKNKLETVSCKYHSFKM